MLKKTARVFDECFDVVDRHFPDFGSAELHHDERATDDNGAGSERQFAYCKDGSPIIIAFAAKSEELPLASLRGLMRHEFGHALEYRYGVKALEEKLGHRLPPKVERRADAIAEAVWGKPIEYDENCVQCIGGRGVHPRPEHLPDKKEKLKANTGKLIGYKSMRFENGRAISGADSRQGFVVRKGDVIEMTGRGIFLSTNRKYIETYYAGHNPREVLLTLEFGPSDIVSGAETLDDREPELTVRSAKIVDFDIVENEDDDLKVNAGRRDWYFEGVDSLMDAAREADPNDIDRDGYQDADGDIAWGRRVGWRVDGRPYVVEVPVEKVQFMEGNSWNHGHAAALLDMIESGERPVFDLPAARLYRIDEDDVSGTQAEYDNDELLYQRSMDEPWEPRDAGSFYVQLVDGNHRALAAMAAGESSIFVTVGPNYRGDVREDEWVRSEEG